MSTADPLDGKTLEDALAEVHSAHQAFTECRAATETARRLENQALDRLNKAQSAFDAAVAKVKSQTARDSEWARKKLPPGVPIDARQ